MSEHHVQHWVLPHAARKYRGTFLIYEKISIFINFVSSKIEKYLPLHTDVNQPNVLKNVVRSL